MAEIEIQKSFYVETPEDVAERIRTALKYVPAGKLWINPDCGFNPTPFHGAHSHQMAI